MPFNAEDLFGKSAAKLEVLARYGLPGDAAALRRPLIGMVSRTGGSEGARSHCGAGVANSRDWRRRSSILGTGEPRYQRFWTEMAAAHPTRIGVRIGFDESLAHLIEGGADMFLMPSRYEPCGLNQMYSLRYGTVPIVRAVGGLADTVRDYGSGVRGATGFTFTDYTPAALLDALQRALRLFERPRAKWQALQVAGMAEDHSWDRSAAEYVKIYDRASRQAPGDTNIQGTQGSRAKHDGD